MVSERNRWRRTQVAIPVLLAAAAVTLFGLFWLIDCYWLPSPGRGGPPHPLARLFQFDSETLPGALGSLAQIIAAVLGIAITVVSIVVQLAATRYTPRVADLFFRDRTNLAVMGFFVVTCIDAIWVSLVVEHGDVPRATVIATVLIVTVSLLLLIPYFSYVFDFLDPEKIIARIGQQTLQQALAAARGSGRSTDLRKRQVLASMEQLADIAVNAVARKDKVIASDAVAALRREVVEYLPRKARLPASWFTIDDVTRDNPDFVALAADSLAELAEARSWLEWKALRQLLTVHGEGLKELPEMAHVVAIETRYIGEAALEVGDVTVLGLAVKFMNTYLRAALNARDIRTAYNVLNQYRQLAETELRRGTATAVASAAEIARHFRYYARLAHELGLDFVAETAAYDLSALCELASDRASPAHDELLACLLDLDKGAETPAQEKSLRGVRKAQAKLAAYYLLRDRPHLAARIASDMALESVDRLRSIREEMLSVTAKAFWEVTDRGTNFDYLDDARKERLRGFFDGFASLGDGPETAVKQGVDRQGGRSAGPQDYGQNPE